MKVTVETLVPGEDASSVSIGTSEMPCGETVSDAVDCFQRALYAAGFGNYKLEVIDEDEDDDNGTA